MDKGYLLVCYSIEVYALWAKEVKYNFYHSSGPASLFLSFFT